MNTKEKVIQYLLSLDREYTQNKLSVDVGRNKFQSSTIKDIGEDKFIEILSLLETEGMIRVNFRTHRRDLQYYITIDLYEPIINYFNRKRVKRTRNFIEVIKWLIPTLISLIALVVAILSYLNTLQVQQLMQ